MVRSKSPRRSPTPTRKKVEVSKEEKKPTNRWRIGTIDEAPPPHRFNKFITTGYRIGMSDLDCIVTLFTTYHNETWNVFTHLVPAMVHIGFLVGTEWDKQDPLVVVAAFFSLCVSVCLLLSARYHLFMASTPDPAEYRMLLKADVIGVTTCFLGATTAMLWLPAAHVDPMLKAGFLFTVYIVSTSLVVLAPDARGRGVGFLVMVVGMLVAVTYRLQSPFAAHPTMFGWVFGVLMLVAGGAINVARIPERWAPPGVFDNFLNSHNIMHMLTAAASFITFYNAIVDAEVAFRHPEYHSKATEAFPVPQWCAFWNLKC